jgi:hypothetical protein
LIFFSKGEKKKFSWRSSLALFLAGKSPCFPMQLPQEEKDTSKNLPVWPKEALPALFYS